MASKSAYAQYCEQKGVKAVALYVDEDLVALMHQCAQDANKKDAQWIRDTFITAVRDAGYEYTPKTRESLQDEVARLKAELAALKAA